MQSMLSNEIVKQLPGSRASKYLVIATYNENPLCFLVTMTVDTGAEATENIGCPIQNRQDEHKFNVLGFAWKHFCHAKTRTICTIERHYLHYLAALFALCLKGVEKHSGKGLMSGRNLVLT